MDPIIDPSTLSKPALLALSITLVCRALKAAPFIKDWTIPMAALFMGSVAYPALIGKFGTAEVLTGIVIGGVTVGLYSTVKQTFVVSREDKQISGDAKPQE